MPAQSYACNLGRLFDQTAMQNAGAPAIRLADRGDVAYGELAAHVNRLTRWLLDRHVGPGKLVALQNSKSLDGYAAMLACLKVGAVYTNLDIRNPRDRLFRILSVCQPTLVLCDEPPAQGLTEATVDMAVPLVLLREHAEEINALEPTDPLDLPIVTGADPAYVMFTSGSTGIPKGVAISHASVLNFIAWVRSVFNVGLGDVVANANPIYFDNSVFDFYAALFSGACLAPVGENELVAAAATVRRVDEVKCTIWFSVPSLLIYLMTMKALRSDTFLSVRCIVFGGEGFPRSELSKLFNLYGDRCELYNVYGPTECTCICSAHRISTEDLRDTHGLPPLGQIADNFSFLLLDGDTIVAS